MLYFTLGDSIDIDIIDAQKLLIITAIAIPKSVKLDSE